MIVVDLPDRFRLVTQPDHAYFAGKLAKLWRADGLPEHPRRDDLLAAAREHDNGWREADAAPRLDREHDRPYDFLTMPQEERHEIWRRGTTRYRDSRPYVALLVTLHALYLHRDRRGEPQLEPLFDHLDPLREDLLEITGADPDLAWQDYWIVGATDQVSLVAASDWTGPFSYEQGDRRLTGSFEDGTLRLDPFPLAGSTTFTLPCRFIPKRPYEGDADLAVEAASARFEEVRVKVAG